MVIRGQGRRKDAYAKTQEKARSLSHKRNRLQVAEMLLRGCATEYICDVVKISPTTVDKIAKDLEVSWRAQADATFAEVRAREIARIEYLRTVAWEAWDASKKGEVVNNIKVVKALRLVRENAQTAPMGEKIKTKKEMKEAAAEFKMQTVGRTSTRNTNSSSPGDVSYLNIVKWATEMLFKIYGIGQTNVTNNNLFVGGDPAASMTVDWDAIARDISDHKEEIEALPPFNPDMQVAQVIPEGEEVS